MSYRCIIFEKWIFCFLLKTPCRLPALLCFPPLISTCSTLMCCTCVSSSPLSVYCSALLLSTVCLAFFLYVLSYFLQYNILYPSVILFNHFISVNTLVVPITLNFGSSFSLTLTDFYLSTSVSSWCHFPFSSVVYASQNQSRSYHCVLLYMEQVKAHGVPPRDETAPSLTTLTSWIEVEKDRHKERKQAHHSKVWRESVNPVPPYRSTTPPQTSYCTCLCCKHSHIL